jgi:purine nucleosidase
MPQSRPLLIDTDPGVDDALAILMCLNEPSVSVKALTVLGGNVSLAHTSRNARLLADRADTTVQVFAGASQPIVGLAPDAAFVHGLDGFGEAVFDAPKTPLESEHAAIAIIETAKRFAGALEILALGPLTNIALALMMEPKLPSLVKRLTIMGGALSAQGNISAFAEFNVAVDPEAAQSVLTRWPGAVIVDWEQTMRHAPSIAENEAWFAQTGSNSQFMRQISRKTLIFKRSIAGILADEAPWAWADPLAAYAALYPQDCEFQDGEIEVILQGRARGASLFAKGTGPIRALTAIDRAQFHARIQNCLNAD